MKTSLCILNIALLTLAQTIKADPLTTSLDEAAESTISQVVALKPGVYLGSQLTKTNTEYEITEDYDLLNKKVVVPSGCTLVFKGGRIRNGVLDLNNCSIVGSGICCSILRPKDQSYPLSSFLADVSNQKLNRSVVQTLLDAKVPVIIDMPEITFDDYLSVKNTAVVQSVSNRRAILNFPNSRGFVWDAKGYSANNSFQSIIINSRGSSFDFVNGGRESRPRNVYLSTFREIRVNSIEGNCFDAGISNLGSTGDSCTFDNLFESIEVIAPKGSGFVGLSSNTQHFIKVRCMGCGVAFFYNCSGVFDSCNGTWGNTTPTFYKGTRRTSKSAARYSCIFRNCNVESYQSVLFDCRDAMCYMDVSFENCSFYMTPNSKKVIDYYPFDFDVLFKLRIFNSKFNYYNDAKFDNQYTLFRIGAPSNISSYDVDQDISFTDMNSYHFTVSGHGTVVNSAAAKSSYQRVVYDKTKNADIDLLRVRALLPTMSSIVINNAKSTQALPLQLGEELGALYNIKCAIDSKGGIISLQYAQLQPLFDSFYSYVPWQFYLRNANENAQIILKNNLAYGGRFVCEMGQDIVLNPGETVQVKYITKEISGSSNYFIVSPVLTKSSYTRNQVGTQRPSNPNVGFQFFDSSLGRPIWWSGSKWVDASGKSVD